MSGDYLPAETAQGKIPGWLFIAGFGFLIAGFLFWQVEKSRGQRERMSPVISEIQARNATGLKDEDGDTADWIELWNPTGEPVDLTGWSLTDDFRRPQKWRFPSATLEPGGFLVVHATGKDRTNFISSLHTNFRLSPAGEYLALIAPDGTRVVHEFLPKYPPQEWDTSFGVLPETFQVDRPRLHRDSRDLTFLLTPTPGQPNRNELLGIVADTQFSHRRGFHREPFELEITTKTYNAQIRYTLDGSEPSEDEGSVYQAPISVDRTTTLRAAAFRPGFKPSNIDTHTYLFPEKLVHPIAGGISGSPHWRDPVALTNAEIRQQIVGGLLAIPNLSMVVPAERSGPTSGRFYPTSLNGTWDEAQRVSMELLISASADYLQFGAGLRQVEGSSTLLDHTERSGFRLLFRNEFGETEFKHQLFGPGGAKTSRDLVVKAGSGTMPLLSLVDDQWRRESLLELGHPVTRGRFVHLFINGDYRGIHLLGERPTGPFLSAAFKHAGEFDVITADGLATGDAVVWEQLLAAGSAAAVAAAPIGNVTLNQVGQFLDLDVFADFMIVNLLAGSWDLPSPVGWYAARPRTTAGRFAFLNGDFAPAFGSSDLLPRSADPRAGPLHLFGLLRKNGEFRKLFIQRAEVLLSEDGPLSPSASGRRYRRLATALDDALVADLARWSDVRADVAWENAVTDRDKSYFSSRLEQIGRQLREEISLAR